MARPQYRVVGAVLGALALAAALGSLPSPVRAATITVTTLADGSGGPACTLRDAITAANTDTATGGCPAGGGADTITFGVTGTILLGSTLPAVSSNSTLTITGPAGGITISGNHAVGVLRVNGGATLQLQQVTIADGAGTAITNGGTLNVTGSTFAGNSSGFVGGAIYNNGTLTVSNSTFSGNNAFTAGGGIENTVGRLTVTNSTFSGNSGSGAGISNTDGTVNVTNSTFSGNNGSAIFSNCCTVTVQNSTISGNSGGIGNLVGPAGMGTVSLYSTIVAANANSTGNCSGPIADGGYNIDDGMTCSFSAVTSKSNTNPLLDPAGLQANGGPTRTVALQPASPAINAIPVSTNGCGTALTTDQRGVIRPQGMGCDSGAFELAGPDSTPPDTSITGATDGTGAAVPNGGTTPSTVLTITFTGTDTVGGISFACSLDGAAFTACTSPVTYTGLSIGPHTVRVQAQDWAGNVDPSPATFMWTVLDTIPPNTTITGATDGTGAAVPAGGETLSTALTVTFTGTDNVAVTGFACSLDGALFMACTSPKSYTGLSTGPHTIAVRAQDGAGNVDPTPATFMWTVLTPLQALGHLVVQTGSLSGGLRESLFEVLVTAELALEDDNPANDISACGALTAFISRVAGALAAGQLTAAQAADFTRQAQAIQTALGCR